MRAFFAGLTRGELALLAVVAVGLVIWAGVGPSGVLAGVLPALALGVLCGVIIGLARARSERH